MDVVVRLRRVCDWRLLPVPMLHYHRVPLWSVVYDAGTTFRCPDGLDYAGSVDDDDEHSGYADNVVWYQHLCVG